MTQTRRTDAQRPLGSPRRPTTAQRIAVYAVGEARTPSACGPSERLLTR